MPMTQRHAEITKLEFQIYPALREQYVTLENYQRVRVAELEQADAASGLTEAERQARIRYRGEWNNSESLREEFAGNLEVFPGLSQSGRCRPGHGSGVCEGPAMSQELGIPAMLHQPHPYREAGVHMIDSALMRSDLYVLIRVRKQFIHENRRWKRGKVGYLPNAVANRLIASRRAELMPLEKNEVGECPW
jgi:hypothetical protein